MLRLRLLAPVLLVLAGCPDRSSDPKALEARTVVLGVDAVVLVSVASDATDDLDALCSEASGVLETIVERLPEAD